MPKRLDRSGRSLQTVSRILNAGWGGRSLQARQVNLPTRPSTSLASLGRVLINRDRWHSLIDVRLVPTSGGKADMLGGTRGEGPHRVCRTKSGSLRIKRRSRMSEAKSGIWCDAARLSPHFASPHAGYEATKLLFCMVSRPALYSSNTFWKNDCLHLSSSLHEATVSRQSIPVVR